MRLRGVSCCGVREINGVSEHRTGPAVLRQFAAYIYGASDYMRPYAGSARFRFAFFTQAYRPSGIRPTTGYGERLAACIRHLNVGNVIETEEAINPNSGNNLKMWVWQVDHDALKAWWEADKKQGSKRQIRKAA